MSIPALDPRRILESAAHARARCELLPRAGGLVSATIVRVERGGIVLTTGEHRFIGGEDIRVWLPLDGRSYRFEASVIRTGVPVPGRGQDGLLIGFIDRFVDGGERTEDQGMRVALIPPSGPPVSLLDPPARLVHISVDGLSFTMPGSYKLIFVEQGSFTVEMAVPGHPISRALGRVRTLSKTDEWMLYDLHFEEVEEPQTHREVVLAMTHLGV